MRAPPRELSNFELQHFFIFSNSERAVIDERRRPAHRLVLALHIGFLRMSGRTLDAFHAVPPMLWRHLGKVLECETPELASVRVLYLERQIGQQRGMAMARVAMDRLKPLERAVLDQVALTGSAYTAPAKQYYAEKLGVESVNNKSIVDAIDKLRRDGLVRWVERGQYRIDDPDVSDAIISQLPPPLQVQALTGTAHADNQPGNQLPAPSVVTRSSALPMGERAAIKNQAREEGGAFLRPTDRLYLPAPGIASKGEVIAVTEHYVYQRTGKTSITVHQVGQLDQERIPAVGEKLAIKYGHDQVQLETLRGRGQER